MASPVAQEFPPPFQLHPEKEESPLAELVLGQLRTILASPSFRNSKRYAAVLRYVIEQALNGNADHLKERTIGVDVFGRKADYDTAADHVVRSAMAEVRKRLTHYYSDSGASSDVLIELQPGSYVPQFRTSTAVAEPSRGSVPLVPAVETAGKSRRLRWRVVGLLFALLPVLALGTLVRSTWGRNDPLKSFWGPVFDSSRDVLLCVGNLEGGQAPGRNVSPIDMRLLSMGDFHRLPGETIHVSDAIALANIVSLLGKSNKRWRIAHQTEADYGDLRRGPVVLIGLMNNQWTERFTGKTRFRAERIAPRTVVIRDARNPQNNSWSMDYATPLLNITRDYALILRVFDPNSDEPVITAAGISVFGTLAASEFLTNPRDLSELSRVAPGWQGKNLEVVLSTEVVRAKTGRPHIVAAQVW